MITIISISTYIPRAVLPYVLTSPLQFLSALYSTLELESRGTQSLLIRRYIFVLTAPSRFIGFKHWSTPFAQDYLGVTGPLGQFLGFWAVLMQAAFSFFGSEVPGIVSLLCGTDHLSESVLNHTRCRRRVRSLTLRV